MNLKKWILVSLLAISCICSVFFLAVWRLNNGFHIHKMESSLSFSPKWEVSNPSTWYLRNLLSQNFYYIGKGSQCFVFESEDKEFILKFFRHSRYRLPKLAELVKAPQFLRDIQDKKRKEKLEQLEALFSSCKIAYECLHEETGLIAVHLNKTHHLKTQVTLYDSLKRSMQIEIDDYEFVLQKRGEQIFPYITALLKKGLKEEAKEALADLASLIIRRSEMKIADNDAVIHKNSGFRNGKAMVLDVGGFSRVQSLDSHEELKQTTKYLKEWLTSQDREIASYFEHITSNQIIKSL